MKPQAQKLQYDPNKWIEIHPPLMNTLQMFITERCNLRCQECFNRHNLGSDDMPLSTYEATVRRFNGDLGKILLSGGEPTLHPEIQEIIRLNHRLGLRTTVYTNGARLDRLVDIPLDGLSVRVSIFGIEDCVKALRDLEPYGHLPVMFTYMLKKDNVAELLEAAQILEREYRCETLLISTCLGEQYWTEYPNTLPLSAYPGIVNDFLADYQGQMSIHVAWRGVILGRAPHNLPGTCRFGNVLTNKLIQCPYDIERDLTTDRIEFGTVQCNKHDACLLGKIIFEPRQPAA